MDVRSIVDVEPEVEHNGTVPVWYLIRPREMNDITRGGSLELVNEFEVAPGQRGLSARAPDARVLLRHVRARAS